MIWIRTRLQRSRRSLLAFGALALTCLTLILAHGAPGLDHMAGMDQGDHVAKAAISLCLAVVQGGVVLLVALGGTVLLRRRSARRPSAPRTVALSSPLRNLPVPAARAGPAVLQVFLR